MKPAAALTLTAAAMLLVGGSTPAARGAIEQGDAAPSFGLDNLAENITDKVETIVNQITEAPADVPADQAEANVRAWLAVIRQAEGTERTGNPYAACYGYSHTIMDFSDHPAVTGEWRGLRLPDGMCLRAGYGPGCVSSAAGAYQIKKGTWQALQRALQLSDFGPECQDRAAVELTRQRGALEDVKAGRFAKAVHACRNEWASLPGNSYGQGAKDLGTLTAWFQSSGGALA